MNHYAAPLDDLRFALYDVWQLERLFQRLPGLENATRDVLDAVLEEAAKFTEQTLAPLNQSGDAEGCVYDKTTASVRSPSGFKEAYRHYVSAGWPGLTAPAIYGGQDLPETLGAAVKEMIDSANLAWSTYPLLSHSAIEALKAHGAPWQHEVFLKPIVEGRWMSTMCLTEPHCGSDLGLLKTKAEPVGNELYHITGNKIFITAGEHDFTENIIHLVLARLTDAPAGTKGISLFIVPKFKVSPDGDVGARNTLSCGSIEHKMGIKGSATCVMNFDAAEGYLLGAPHRGLAAMFTMMNMARLAVGLQGLGLMERAYQNAVIYAKDRLQLRALSGTKYPDKPADPLIVHPDIRRMLLTQKAFVEGGRVLAIYAHSLIDLQHRSADVSERQRAEELVSFLTPIVKALLTEAAIECTYHALQIFGGHGYITEWGMEQLARDARITTVYEGTTQIQAIDLLGRKVIQQQGIGLKHFLEEISAFCHANASNTALREFIAPLAVATKDWADITQTIAQRVKNNPEELGAAAVDYLFYSGYVTLAYCWAKSVAAVETSNRANPFKTAKRHTAHFYFARILPRIHTHAAAIHANIDTLMAMPEDLFA